MKSIREYQLKLNPETANSEGTTWGTPFSPPMHATVGGVPVRVTAIGNLAGASDVFLCTDGTGFAAPIKRTDVVITDGAYLPLKDDEGALHTSAR